jgi:Tol biopolymer transport system component
MRTCFHSFDRRGVPDKEMFMKAKMATIALAILTVFVLAGCSADRWIGIEPGEYVVAKRAGTASTTASAEIQKIAIDRDKQLAIFTLLDESEMAVSFVPRDKAAWPSGCPANINSTRMEVLDIKENRLTVGSITLSNPILVRDCPPAPMRVVLRQDGDIGGSGGACARLNECIFFVPQPVSALRTASPRSTPTPSPVANIPISPSLVPTVTTAPATIPAADPDSLPPEDPILYSPGSELKSVPHRPVVDIPGGKYGVLELGPLDPPDCCPAVAPDGERLTFATCRTVAQKVFVQNVDGSGLKEISSLRISDGDGPCPDPAWSPDGGQLVFVNYDYSLYVVNADGTNLTRLEPRGMAPVWSPDGQEIAFTAHPSQEELVIGVMNRDGSDLRLLADNGAHDQLPSWSPDGRHIAFVSNRDGNREIYVMNRDGSNRKRLTYHEAQDWGPVWSPDGRYIVFTSDRNGRNGIYVMSRDGADQRWLMNADAPGRWPMDTTRVRFVEVAE